MLHPTMRYTAWLERRKHTMERNQIIAVVVIVVIVVGAVGVYMFITPPGPTVPTIIVGTTDSVESSLDMAQT